jgi:inorganic pyrophosphatase
MNDDAKPGLVEVVVEIPRGSRNKYEEGDDGVIWFDRRLGGPVGFPGDYGYVIGHEGEDGDALDALVLLDEPTFPGVHIRCRVIGSYVLEVDDDAETKLICVPERDHHQDHLQDLEDLPANAREELDAFFESYRMLESKRVSVIDHQDRAATVSRMRETDD